MNKSKPDIFVRQKQNEQKRNEYAQLSDEEKHLKTEQRMMNRKIQISDMTSEELAEYKKQQKEYQQKWYQLHKDEHKARSAQRRITHAQEIKMQQKIYNQEHKEEKAIADKERRLANPQYHNEINKKWRDENKDKVSEYNRQYNEAHAQQRKERNHINYLKRKQNADTMKEMGNNDEDN